jgi:tripartite-type tricarboxylate transporter receptor subunit TctC
MKRWLVALPALLCAELALAQGTYPNRPVTTMVGFAPGGGTDITARIVAKKLPQFLGQPVVVENRAGAGGNIATDAVAKAAPDGYTLILSTVGSLTVAPHIEPRLP